MMIVKRSKQSSQNFEFDDENCFLREVTEQVDLSVTKQVTVILHCFLAPKVCMHKRVGPGLKLVLD